MAAAASLLFQTLPRGQAVARGHVKMNTSAAPARQLWGLAKAGRMKGPPSPSPQACTTRPGLAVSPQAWARRLPVGPRAPGLRTALPCLPTPGQAALCLSVQHRQSNAHLSR